MARRTYSSEQIIIKLRQADVLSSQGKNQMRYLNNLEYQLTPMLDGEKSMVDLELSKQNV